MKIVKFGEVIITSGEIKIQNFLATPPDESDPPGASPEQLLLTLATKWAMNRLGLEIQKAMLGALKQGKPN